MPIVGRDRKGREGKGGEGKKEGPRCASRTSLVTAKGEAKEASGDSLLGVFYEGHGRTDARARQKISGTVGKSRECVGCVCGGN